MPCPAVIPDPGGEKVVLVRLDLQELFHGFRFCRGFRLVLKETQKHDQCVADEEHADEQQDSGNEICLIKISVPDIACEKEDDHCGGKGQKPRGLPDRRRLDRGETVDDLHEPLHHKPGGEKHQKQCDNAGLPGVESAVQKLSVDKKGGGADHHEVVQDKGVLEGDDSDVCLNQIVEEKSQNGNC